MAGIQIDGVNNKIDFDDDLDTSISANTDDTLVIEAGGNTMATITATTFTINDGTTITTADNTDTLTLISTDADATQGPVLNLYRNSSAVEDDNDIARINFTGNDSGGNATTYASTRVIINDVTDGTEDTQIIHSQMIGGEFVSTLRCKPDEIVLNDSSIDLDFRVESNGNENMLFVDGGNDKVGIGTASPQTTLHVEGTAPIIRISDSNSTSEDDAVSKIQFYDRNNTDLNAEIISGTGSLADFIISNHNNRALIFQTNGNTERMRIKGDGNVGIGTDGPQARLDCETPATGTPAFEAHATSGSYTTEVVKLACARNTTNSSYKFLACNVPGINDRLQILDSGNVLNINNSYGAISDERLKSNIVDANSQWDDIKALKVRNFKKADSGDMIHLGVVAQELEAAGMNGLIQTQDPSEYDIGHNSVFGTLYTADDAETKDGNDQVLYVAEDAEVIDGAYNVGDIKKHATHSKKVGDVKEVSEQVKSVKYSVLYMKAIKALQEAQTRIETLETKVAALEG
jgi:hypothetical protein